MMRASAAVEPFDPDLPALAHYRAFPFDSQLFYDPGDHDEELADYRPEARRFYALVQTLKEEAGIGDLPAYLAVIAADGDRMGAAIARLPNQAAHRHLSARLADFARQVASIVRYHRGLLVYSGGDDVLAFAPLDTALRCADDLRRAFTAIVQAAAAPSPVSLSMGVAIGHYAAPLQNLLEWARDAERAAKRTRNALAVALHTHRSGGSARARRKLARLRDVYLDGETATSARTPTRARGRR